MKFPVQHITFEITQECNLSCIYCYNHWRRNDHKPYPTTIRDSLKTINRIFKTIEFQHITITGGEPFLAEGLEEIVLKCRMKRKGVNIITNGTAAKPSSYKMLTDLGVSLFEIPFHSANPDIHDSMTGCPGSHHKVLQSIGLLKEYKGNICLVCVLTRNNITDFNQTLDAVSKLGIKRFMLARYNIGGRGIEKAKDIVPPLDGLRSVFKTANDFVKNQNMIISANVCVPFCIINPKDYPGFPISSCGSDPKKRPITIDSSGNIRLCNHSPVIIGNIHSESMDTIFRSVYVNSWNTVCPEYCLKCELWEKCRGGCRAASEQMGKTINCVDPIIGFM